MPIAVYTALALIAFAANSLLCRLALAQGSIDPATFTAIRLGAGAVTLWLLVRFRRQPAAAATPSWGAAVLLCLYAVPFSFGYRQLTTGTGALLLFGAVQITMILGGLRQGRSPAAGQWLGLVMAGGGLVYLVLPGLAAPPVGAAALMLIAGMSWGLYSLRGRAVADPLGQTAANFLRSIPLVLLVLLVSWGSLTFEPGGALLAILSGALASGVGYVLWYRALPGLPPIVASLVQLAVPPLAAAGGIAALGEPLTSRLMAASALILGGIAVALIRHTHPS